MRELIARLYGSLSAARRSPPMFAPRIVLDSRPTADRAVVAVDLDAVVNRARCRIAVQIAACDLINQTNGGVAMPMPEVPAFVLEGAVRAAADALRTVEATDPDEAARRLVRAYRSAEAEARAGAISSTLITRGQAESIQAAVLLASEHSQLPPADLAAGLIDAFGRIEAAATPVSAAARGG